VAEESGLAFSRALVAAAAVVAAAAAAATTGRTYRNFQSLHRLMQVSSRFAPDSRQSLLSICREREREKERGVKRRKERDEGESSVVIASIVSPAFVGSRRNGAEKARTMFFSGYISPRLQPHCTNRASSHREMSVLLNMLT
jgi:hypothetical protein